MKYLFSLILITCSTLYLTGCQSRLLTVYKIDVQQGNAVEAEAVNKITLGMNKEQVRFVLGSPLIVDSFHPDRWDYVYLFTPGYGEEQRRQLTVIFDRGEVIDIVKHNIVAENTSPVDSDEDDSDKQSESESETITDEQAEDEQQEQEELEKQVDELKDILETNKDPTN